MKRLERFECTLKKAELAYQKDKSYFPLEWIIRDLQYLINIEKGISKDVSLLPKIKIGHIAVREMDGFEDEDLINALSLVQKEADLMVKERGL